MQRAEGQRSYFWFIVHIPRKRNGNHLFLRPYFFRDACRVVTEYHGTWGCLLRAPDSEMTLPVRRHPTIRRAKVSEHLLQLHHCLQPMAFKFLSNAEVHSIFGL